MSQFTPTLDDIRITFFKETQKILTDDVKAGKVFIVPPAQDADPALKKIIVLCSFTPGIVDQQEIGWGTASGNRHGIWKMTISSLKDVNANEPWAIAEKLENAFAPYSVSFLPVNSFQDDIATECKINCDFPYSQNIGEMPDKRNGITVTVPWWTWVEKQEI